MKHSILYKTTHSFCFLDIMMLFFTLTWLLFTQATCLPNNIENLMLHFFNNTPSSYYFCNLEDAVKVIGKNKGKYAKVKLLNKKTDFEIKFDNSQTINVFLDLSCDVGYNLLEENLNLFNVSYHWLLWSEDVEMTLEFLRPSRISIDSDVILATRDVKLYDLFRIHRILNIEAVHIGYLSHDAFDLFPRPSRTNFKQFAFNTSLMMTDIQFNMSNLIPPILDRSYANGVDMVRRYGLVLFLQMAERYNFTMNYITTNAWGEALPNGTWTGMLGHVVAGKAEFGLAPAKYSVARTGVIDFITSVNIVRICFTFLQPKLFGSYKALLLPLEPVVWACLGVCSFFGVVAFKAVSKYDLTSSCNDNLGGSTLMVISSISQQGFPDNSYKLSTRIVYVSMLFVTFLTATYYNTAILNGLLLPAPNAIQNIEQLLKSDIKLGMLNISYIVHETHTYNDTHSRQVRKKLAKIDPKNHFFSVKDGVKKMKKGQFALYTEDEAIYTEILRTMSDAQVCALSEVEKYQPFHVGAVAKDNSPYKDLFNKGFMMMRERGLMARQKDYWFIKKPECHWKQDAISLGLEPMALAYFLLITGFFLALIVLSFEMRKSRKNLKLQLSFNN